MLQPNSYMDLMLQHINNPNIFQIDIAMVFPREDGVDHLPKHYLEALHCVEFTLGEVHVRVCMLEIIFQMIE